MKVLVAEDNPVNQEVAIGFLESLGCDVTVVENGAEAVKAVQKAPPVHFDVVLMDCQMPVMDGFEATRNIRAIEHGGRAVPILALTANAFDGSKARCLEAGMDDVLNKPLRRQELNILLNRWRSKGACSEPDDDEPKSDSDDLILDLERMQSLRDLDPDGSKGLVRRAVMKFDDYSEVLMSKMASSLAENDMAEMSRLAHSLKSSSANLGAMDLSKRCDRLEASTRNLGRPPDAEEQVKALAEAHKKVKQALRSMIEG